MFTYAREFPVLGSDRVNNEAMLTGGTSIGVTAADRPVATSLPHAPGI
jgi:hypothetical protein